MDKHTQGDVYEQAIDYIRAGWAVIPVHGLDSRGICTCGGRCDEKNKGKHPIRKGWTEGPTLSAADAWSVWREEYPDGNIGLRTGTASNVLAIDIDPAGGGIEGLARLETEHGSLPRTRKHQTGSGGHHYLFKMPNARIRNSVSRLAPGVDVRSDGGMIVLPPSVSGKGSYSVVDDYDLVDPPTWIVELLTVSGPSLDTETVVVEDLPARADLDEDTAERVQRYAERVLEMEATEYRDSAPGYGNHQLFQSACNIIEIVQSPWNDLEIKHAHDLLNRARLQRNALHPYGGGQSDHEFSQTFMSARSKVVGRGRPLPPAPEAPDAGIAFDPGPGYEAKAAEPAEPKVDPVKALLARLMTPAQVINRPNPVPLVHGLLNMDSEAMLLGEPGSFKSFVALDMAAHIGRGQPWRGRKTRQGTVLYVVAEGLAGIKLRINAWQKTHGEMTNVHFLGEAIQVKDEHTKRTGQPSLDWAVLVAACREIQPAFVVIDTQSRVTVGIEENSANEMGVYIKAVNDIRKATGACVLSVHHTARGGMNARGSGAQDGAQDTKLRLARQEPRSDMRVKLTVDKQKDMEELENPIDLRMVKVDEGVDPDTGQDLGSLVVGDGEPFQSGAKPLTVWEREISEGVVQIRIIRILLKYGKSIGMTKAEARKIYCEQHYEVSATAWIDGWNSALERKDAEGDPWVSKISGEKYGVVNLDIINNPGSLTENS